MRGGVGLTALAFRCLGDFWLDNGYESLFTNVSNLSEEIPGLQVDQSAFELRGTDDAIRSVLSRVVENAVREYVRRSGNLGIYYDERAGKFQTYEKESWWPHLEFLYTGMRAAPKTRGAKKLTLGQNYQAAWDVFLKSNPNWKAGMPKEAYTDRLVLNLKSPLELKGRSQSCSFCGRVDTVVKVQLNLYPFMVDRDKMASFYGGWTHGPRMCWLCATASRLAPMNLLYRNLGDDGCLHFLAGASNLKRLSEIVALASTYVPTDSRAREFSNFRIDMGRYVRWQPRFLNESLLMFLLTIFVDHMDRGLPPEKLQDMRWFGFHTVVSSGMPSYPRTLMFDRTSELYGHFKEMKEQGIDLPAIVDGFWYIREGERPDRATRFREQLALKVLGFSSVLSVVEEFLYESGRVPPRVDDFVTYYEKAVMKMDAESVDRCMKLGSVIGMQAYQAEERGKGGSARLLYEIRNSRKVADLFNALNRAQFELGVRSIDESLVKEIETNPRDWDRYKLIISIAAKNAYERAKYRKGSREEKE